MVKVKKLSLLKFKVSVIFVLSTFLLVGNSHSVMIDRIVAVVNGDIITKSDVDKIVFEEFKRVPLSGVEKLKKEKAEQDALTSLIETKLLVSAAYALGLAVTAEEVERQILGMLQVRNIEEAGDILLREGINLELFKERIKSSILLRKLAIREGFSDVSVTDKDINAYFNTHDAEFPKEETVELRAVILRVPKGSPPGVWKKYGELGKGLLEKIQSSGFDAVAASSPSFASFLPQQKYNLKDMSAVIKTAVMGLSKSETTSLLKMPYGYALFNVKDRYRIEPGNNKEIKNKIYKKLMFDKSLEKRGGYIKELKKKARLEILL